MKYLILFACIAVAGASDVSIAGDHTNLEEGVPVRIEDAYPIGYEGREVLVYSSYERTGDGEDRFELTPRLEYGFAHNWQAEFEAPFIFGGTDKTTSGNVDLSLMYNFNTELLWVPAISLKGTAEVPSGIDSAGVDTRAALILTKTLSRSTFFHRLHLNLEWRHNSSPSSEEREDRYVAGLGYQVRLGPNNQLLADVFREQDLKKNKNHNVAEIGLRHQWDPLTVLALGVGAGFADQSPDFRITLGLQRALNF
ncbi:MAG TPA: meta-pathway of phenol degradation [Bdellovibrionota bacterium]|nr:meta-pathway of phenol degradation [Bdellovibrionota bacterium]